MTEITCRVHDCVYNLGMKCTSDKIEISPHRKCWGYLRKDKSKWNPVE